MAEQGYPLAECQIGYFYLEGLGVEKNAAQAVRWFRESALQGHGLAIEKCRVLGVSL